MDILFEVRDIGSENNFKGTIQDGLTQQSNEGVKTRESNLASQEK